MKNVILFTMWLLMVIIAVKFVGWWTLAISLGIPSFVWISLQLPELVGDVRALSSPGLSSFHHEILDKIVRSDGVTEESHAEALGLLSEMKVVIKGKKVKFTNTLLKLSNKYVGKFLGHVLWGDEYTDTTYKKIAEQLKKNRPDMFVDVLDEMRKVNVEVAEKIYTFV